MIKIVTIDLDGTLFDNIKNISKENIDAIKKCHELGVKIVIATGRPLSGVLPVINRLGLNTNNDYAIIYNGAQIVNCGTKEIIYSSLIFGKDIKRLYKESINFNLYYHAFRINGELITNKHNQYTDIEKINNVTPVLYNINDVKDNDEFLKCMIVGPKELVDICEKNIDNTYYKEYSTVRSATVFLEFLNPNANKGYGLIELAKYLNVDIKDTMAIGDAGNDIPMIKAAGIGVAMKNSFKEVIDIADFVTLSNEESGVAYALNKFIIEKES